MQATHGGAYYPGWLGCAMFAARGDDKPVKAVLAPGQVRRVDARHLWHPYAGPHATPEYVVTAAQGSRLWLADADGVTHEVVDAMASWWSMVHGYRHPVLDAAVAGQVSQFSHVMFGGLTHEPAAVLADQLTQLAPQGLTRVFLADSGSVSVEVALKCAMQAQQGRAGKGHRKTPHRFVSLRGGYHGDTSGAMSVTDPRGGFHAQFAGALPEQVFAPQPPLAQVVNGVVDVHAQVLQVQQWAEAVRSVVAEHADQVAGIIFEPVLQGVGGMWPYPAECVQLLRDIADEFQVLLIADEIATGFGRTGQLWAVDHCKVTPDIMCVGKALTGGYMSMAAMLCTDQVADWVAASESGVLMHGPTFMGNPLACAVAQASLNLLQVDPWAPQVQALERGLASGLAPALQLPHVREVRVFAGVGVIDCVETVNVAAVTAAAVHHGVWVRPFRNMVYTMPPYVVTEQELAQLTSGMVAAVKEAGQ